MVRSMSVVSGLTMVGVHNMILRCGMVLMPGQTLVSLALKTMMMMIALTMMMSMIGCLVPLILLVTRSLVLMERFISAESGLTLAGAHNMIQHCGMVLMPGQKLVKLALPMMMKKIPLLICALNGRVV